MDLLNIINIILSVIASAFSIVISFLAVKNANKTNEPQKREANSLNPTLNINVDSSTNINSNNTINIGSNNVTNINYVRTNQDKQCDSIGIFILFCFTIGICWCLLRVFAFFLILSLFPPLFVAKFKYIKCKKDNIFLISTIFFLAFWSFFYWFPIGVQWDYTVNLFDSVINFLHGNISSTDFDISNVLQMLTVAISQLLGSIILFLLLIASFVDNCCNNFNLLIKQSSLSQISNLCNTKTQIVFAIISLILITGLLGKLIIL